MKIFVEWGEPAARRSGLIAGYVPRIGGIVAIIVEAARLIAVPIADLTVIEAPRSAGEKAKCPITDMPPPRR